MHKVVINGLRNDIAVRDAILNLATLFKVSPQQVDILLKHPGYVVKKGISSEVALKYKQALEAAGASCSIEKEQFKLEANDTQPIESQPTPTTLPPAIIVPPALSQQDSVSNAEYLNDSAKLNERVADKSVISDGSILEKPEGLTDGVEVSEHGNENAQVRNFGGTSGKSILITSVIVFVLGLLGKFTFIAALMIAVVFIAVAMKNALDFMRESEQVDAGTRVVTDVTVALTSGGLLTFIAFIAGWALEAFSRMPFTPVVPVLMAGFIAKVFAAEYIGIILDEKNDILSIQGSELDNGLLDVLTFKEVRNKMIREHLKLSEVEGVFSETIRWTTKTKDSDNRTKTKKHVQFSLNITGPFGSRKLNFSQKQKRDEARSAILTCSKNVKASPIEDVLVDMG